VRARITTCADSGQNQDAWQDWPREQGLPLLASRCSPIYT